MGAVVRPRRIRKGGCYWAAWGTTGWSAIEVTDVKRKFVQATRVHPKTNERVKTGCRVRISKLLERNPALKGKDRPNNSPPEVFAVVEALEAPAPVPPPPPAPEPEPAPEPVPAPVAVERTPEERIRLRAKLVALLDGFEDDSTEDDW